MSRTICADVTLQKRRDLGNQYFSTTFGPVPSVRNYRPGQFVHVQLPSADILFRRAFSVAAVDIDRQELEIIFKVFGRGTRLLGKLCRGDTVSFLGPLGNGFTFPPKKVRSVMVAGGVGFPPLLFLAERMVARGFDPKGIEFFYGGKTKAEIVERSRIKKLGVRFHAVTDDGSFGAGGLVTDEVEKFIGEYRLRQPLRLFGCGPAGMLKATDELGMKYNVDGQLSLEAPMPCGLGVCLGCMVELTNGNFARVCWDGPVFDIGSVKL